MWLLPKDGFGLAIRFIMLSIQETGLKHNVPHTRAEHYGDEAVVALEGTVLEGAIPKSKMKLLKASSLAGNTLLEFKTN